MIKCWKMNCLVMMMTLMMVESRPMSYDMQSVGSLRRDVRQEPTLQLATEVSDLLAAAPIKKHHKKQVKNVSGKANEGGFYKQFGSDADGEKGYLKKSYSDGNHGYKNFGTFHKQIGDRYGFEEHEETGKGSAADSDKHQAKRKETKKKQSGDHEGAGTDDVEYYSSGEGGDYSGYSGGDGGDGESSSYNDGSVEGYNESYSSGDEGDGSEGGGDGEAYSSGESYASSGEDGSYY